MANLSASNATIGKARERAALIDAHSRRTLGGYVFTAAGAGDSTTDLAWDGQLLIYELGEKLSEGPRFKTDGAHIHGDIDLDRIKADRLRLSTWRDSVARHAHALKNFQTISFAIDPDLETELPIERAINRS